MVATDGSFLQALDLKRGTRAPLTKNAPSTSYCVWNADGSRIFYSRFNVPMWIAADGSDQQGAVNGAQAGDVPTGPGLDPESMIFLRVQPESLADIFFGSLNGSFEPRPLVSTEAFEGGGQLSPDNRWLGYASDESGQVEVYVRRFPQLDRQWQISEGGGTQLRWSADGREIYFRNGANLMAVSFEGTADEPSLGKPFALFRDDYDLGTGATIANYDVTPEGRFLMLRREARGGQLRIVPNWTEELKRILASQP